MIFAKGESWEHIAENKKDVSGPVFVFQERREKREEGMGICERFLIQICSLISPSAGKSPHDTKFSISPTFSLPDTVSASW